ncbi:MAG TPA: hypothetical protein ENJ76_03430 [Oceanithermus sp.]|nr:hypothetical protein [Oceanithermus sp.]
MLELALFAADTGPRYELMLELLREALGGQVYENPVARLVHAPAGVLCELKAPLFGVHARTGPAVAEVVDERAARRILWEALAQAEEGGELLVVYDERRQYRTVPEPAGEPLLRPPYCLILRAGRERRWLFFTGREFLYFRLEAGLPVLGPIHE